MQFRKDINGLRAFAVIAVMLFHFNSSWMPGGFAGVDVFFVISGFLMTGIIFRGIEQDNFSILTFYVARANRIVPALAVLCLVLLVFGWFYLIPPDYKTLGKHVGNSIGFFSNIIYWREAGSYFAADSQEKWLLHTWSLSAEWQFYMLYPLALVVMRKFMSLKTMKLMVLTGAIIGFIFCVIATHKWLNAAYYLLPTRAWEMMLGGVAYLYPLNIEEKKKKLIEWSGVTLIIASFFLISKENQWPGYLALIPVFGAFLVIQVQRNDSFITGNLVCQKIGSWSYSLYLWHWPLVVAIHYFSLSSIFIYPGIVFSILLGFISNKYIEKIKFRKNFGNFSEYLKCKPISVMIIMGILGSSVFYTNGALNRYSGNEKSLMLSSIQAGNDWAYPAPNRHINGLDIRYIEGHSDKNILFMGASHAEQTYPYVANLKQKYNIYYLTSSGCLVTPSMHNPKWSCSNIQGYKKLLADIHFDKIVTTFYCFNCNLPGSEIEKRITEYDSFLKTIKSNAKEVYLIKPEPEGDEFSPLLSVRHNLKGYITEKEVRKKYNTLSYALSKLTELHDIKVIDPIEYLCHNGVCLTRSKNNKFYYKDFSHMRPWYAKKYSTYLNEIFDLK